jgi:alpha-mannosidase
MKTLRTSIISFAAAIVLITAPALTGPATDKENRSPAMNSLQEKPAKAAVSAAGGLPIISSSHQDIAWMDSPEKCMEFRDKNVITPALALLAKDPAYAFTMENMLNLREYLERHPERRDEVVRFTQEGRMEWGATFNQPYESLLSGEQLIRETYFGRRWLKKTFPDCDARVYFNPDVPGRSLQMPQVLAKAGIPYMVMSRYHEGYYRWASPDGTSVLAYSPGHYGNAAAYLNAPPAEGAKAIADKVAKWAGYYASRGLPPQYPLLNSVDFSQPTDFGPLIKLWNGSSQGPAGVPLTMRYSSARRFFEALDLKTAKLETITGERPGLWLYIHGPTHHWAISAQREAGALLPAAETFSTVRALLEGSFQDYPAERLNAAWEAAIYPDHGWGGKEGQVTDRLFRKKYEFARDEGRAVLEVALSALAGRVKTQAGRGLPIVVFNALSWARTDPVVCDIPAGNGAFRVVDGDGKNVPLQVLPALEGQPEGTVRVEFIAADVPGLGYRTFYLVGGAAPAAKAAAAGPPNVVENAFYRIELAPGGVKSVFDKELGREVLETGKFLGFEVFTMRSVGNGAGEFGRVQQPTMEGFDRLGLHGPAWKYSAADSGPLRTVFTLEQSLANCVVRERLIVRNDVKRIDCEVDILKWDGDPYREFRVALPVRAANGHIAYEVPLGVVEVGKSEIAGTGGPAYGNLVYDELCSDIRPREVQNFIGAWDASAGVTLTSSVAVCDFKDPTPTPVPYPILQPILLASRRSCHGEGNWYLQEGDHHYRFSMTSHGPDWRKGYKPGIQPNNPLVAVVGPAAAPGASLPGSMGFVRVSAANILVSTLKKAEDDASVILRVYDIEGRDAEPVLGLFVPLKSAEKTNIIEEDGMPLKPGKDGLTLKVGHHAIETLKLVTAGKQ